MLTCMYHPIDHYRVVEEDEAERLASTGVWFDSPAKAKQYRAKVEDEIKQEAEVDDLEQEHPKQHHQKAKPKGKYK